MPILTVSTSYTINLYDWSVEYLGVVRDANHVIVATSSRKFESKTEAHRAAENTRHEMIITGNY